MFHFPVYLKFYEPHILSSVLVQFCSQIYYSVCNHICIFDSYRRCLEKRAILFHLFIISARWQARKKDIAEASDKNTKLTSFFFREDNSKIIVVKIFTISFQNLSANSFVTEGNSTVVEENKLTTYIWAVFLGLLIFGI